MTRPASATRAASSGSERVVGLVLVLKEHRHRVEALEPVASQAASLAGC